MPNATASGSDAANGNGAKSRAHNQGNQERKFTPEQKAAVLRIRRCQATAFYEILDVQKSCTDVEVKKAYRKQSLLTHPDKNGHEHADEAFKMVSRAFSVLGDKEKREKFDRFGTDPDSRFDSARAQAQNPFAGFANRGAAGRAGGMGGGGGGGGMWEDEISPEEMFARFFGGGGFGGPFGGGGAFDTGPQFVFNFGGGPGVRVHQFGGARPRARPRDPNQPEPDTSITSTLLGLLPILLLFIFPLLTSLFSGGATQASMPNIALEKPSPPYYTMERSIPVHNVKYYVNPNEVAKFSDSKLHQLDKQAEIAWRNLLNRQCENELNYKRRLREDAQGWFFQDPVKMEMANSHPTPSCERLTKANQRSR